MQILNNFKMYEQTDHSKQELKLNSP